MCYILNSKETQHSRSSAKPPFCRAAVWLIQSLGYCWPKLAKTKPQGTGGILWNGQYTQSPLPPFSSISHWPAQLLTLPVSSPYLPSAAIAVPTQYITLVQLPPNHPFLLSLSSLAAISGVLYSPFETLLPRNQTLSWTIVSHMT